MHDPAQGRRDTIGRRDARLSFPTSGTRIASTIPNRSTDGSPAASAPAYRA